MSMIQSLAYAQLEVQDGLVRWLEIAVCGVEVVHNHQAIWTAQVIPALADLVRLRDARPDAKFRSLQVLNILIPLLLRLHAAEITITAGQFDSPHASSRGSISHALGDQGAVLVRDRVPQYCTYGLYCSYESLCNRLQESLFEQRRQAWCSATA